MTAEAAAELEAERRYIEETTIEAVHYSHVVMRTCVNCEGIVPDESWDADSEHCLTCIYGRLP